MDEQQLRDDLNRLGRKVEEDQTRLNDAEANLREKRADEADADRAMTAAKDELDHAWSHVNQDFRRLETEPTEEARAELEWDQRWRDDLLADHDVATANHHLAENALERAKMRAAAAKTDLEIDRASRDQKRRLLDEMERLRQPR